MKNQIKNDLNNIKNSGQIVINTAISNDNGSRQYRASDVIEKGKSTNFMKREEIFAVLGAVASGVTIVDFLFNRLGENAVLKLGKILYEAFIEHNTAPYYFLIAELIAIICFGAVSFSAFRNVITLHKARHLGACIYNRDRKKSYKIKALPCPHCKTTFRTPLKSKTAKTLAWNLLALIVRLEQLYLLRIYSIALMKIMNQKSDKEFPSRLPFLL